MEVEDGLTHSALGLLLGPLLAMLLMALCVRCRRLPDSYNSASSLDGVYPRSILVKPPCTVSREMMHQSPASYPSMTSDPPLSQPDLLRIPRSPQPPESSHRMPSSRRDSSDAQSVASYENESAWGGVVAERLGPQLGSVPGRAEPHCRSPAEPACKGADEDEDEDQNEGYLEVLPDNGSGLSNNAASAPVPSNPGLRDSAFSMESGDDYVNVPESGGSADASLDGSREYVNVLQELPVESRSQPATLRVQEVGGKEEEEEPPDYENLQGLN
ncbi:linker for activation of T-cells family member 1 isoform X1 [Ochotona princeps]|uniref:linker for activation of T-cells family member 1 isoform X1 n=1 Tax=Ochotona princeps TaxID=9978 RepID=UPI002714D022|nr:linker for activation of T-cells family member 1 isoform X1 [Ochotona princeps]